MSESTHVRWPGWRKAALAATFASVALLAAADLAVDLAAGTTIRHAIVEGGMGAIGLAAAGALIIQLVRTLRAQRRLERDTSQLRASLARSEQDAGRWRKEASKWTRGLADAIDQQLSQWKLSPAEKEIALLLLKGLSHKEIAEARAVAESSVRQQARSLYQKAGLQGRHELAAFFLEDLLAPPGAPRPPLEARR